MPLAATPVADASDLLATQPGDTTLAQRYGVTKVVYALVYPETRAMLDALWGARPHELFDRAYLDAQDGAEIVFIDRWCEWAEPVIGDLAPFRWRYATAGSTEAIRESIWVHALRCRHRNREPRVHVFEGEYEGYSAYAAAAGVRVITHLRSEWRRSLADRMTGGDQWYVSHPSAIDGNIWPEFDAWLDHLACCAPTCQVMLDATYVGAVNKPLHVCAAHPLIHTLFFSLSKVFGVYYHRIGGCVSREEMPGLYGNRWFKNMFSLHLGAALLSRFGVHDLPGRYAMAQAKVCRQLSQRLGRNDLVQPSDAVILAHIAGDAASAIPAGLHALRRGHCFRLCLTPALTDLLAAPASESTP